MKVKYIGPNIGVMSLTNGKVYEVMAIEDGTLRVNDDDPNWDEGYLYDAKEPSNSDGSVTGKWEIVEDDEQGSLKKAIEG